MSPLAGHVHDLSALGPVDWAIVGAAALLVGWVFWLAIRWTLHPGEEDPHHLKRLILEEPSLDASRAPRDAGREA